MIPISELHVGKGAHAGIAMIGASHSLIARTYGVPEADLVSVDQVHGTKSVVISHSDRSDAGTEADAMITAEGGLILCIKVADCCGVLLHDPDRHVVAAIHSGWRGSAAKITTSVVQRLQEEFGVETSHLYAALSPCASGAHYEVGKDVYDRLSEFCVPVDGKPDKWWFDNHAAIEQELLCCGVRLERITVDRRCTITDLRFHSYRREGQKAGRNLAYIGM